MNAPTTSSITASPQRPARRACAQGLLQPTCWSIVHLLCRQTVLSVVLPPRIRQSRAGVNPCRQGASCAQALSACGRARQAGPTPSGAQRWTAIPPFGSGLISGNWFRSSAQTSATVGDLTNPSYIVGYVCTWIPDPPAGGSGQGGRWMCGCRDSACTQSYHIPPDLVVTSGVIHDCLDTEILPK